MVNCAFSLLKSGEPAVVRSRNGLDSVGDCGVIHPQSQCTCVVCRRQIRCGQTALSQSGNALLVLDRACSQLKWRRSLPQKSCIYIRSDRRHEIYMGHRKTVDESVIWVHLLEACHDFDNLASKSQAVNSTPSSAQLASPIGEKMQCNEFDNAMGTALIDRSISCTSVHFS